MPYPPPYSHNSSPGHSRNPSHSHSIFQVNDGNAGAGTAVGTPTAGTGAPIRRRRNFRHASMGGSAGTNNLSHPNLSDAGGSGAASSSHSRNASGSHGDLVKICSHCKVTETPLWRHNPETGERLCNACGCYLRMYKRMRPIHK